MALIECSSDLGHCVNQVMLIAITKSQWLNECSKGSVTHVTVTYEAVCISFWSM